MRRNDRKDETYLSWVRGQKCCVPSCSAGGVAHHVVSRNRGRFDYPVDGVGGVVPVCPYHHNMGGNESIHGGGKRSFEDRFGVDLQEVAVQTWEAYRGDLQ